MRRIVHVAFREVNPTRFEKVANTIEARLPIYIKPIVDIEIEGTKCFSSPGRTILKVIIKHLFPRRRVKVSGVRNDTIEVEQNRIVLGTCDNLFPVGTCHRWSPVAAIDDAGLVHRSADVLAKSIAEPDR